LNSVLIDGTGTIFADRTASTNGTASFVVNNGHTLTFGADLTVRGSNLNISRASSTAHVVNEGTFESDVAGRAINFSGLTSFINNSDLIATNGGDFTFNSSWTNNGNISIVDAGILTINGVGTNSASGLIVLNTGTLDQNNTVTNEGLLQLTDASYDASTLTNSGSIQLMNTPFVLGNGSTLNNSGAITSDGPSFSFGADSSIWINTGTITLSNQPVILGGNFTLVDLRNIVATNLTYSFTGTLIATGETIELDSDFGGDLLFNGARLVGGTVTSTSGLSKLVFNNNTSNRMDVVTVNVDIDMTASDAQLDLATGLTLNGTLFLTTLGNSDITTLNSVLIDGTGTIFADRTASTNGTASFVVNNGHTLTFGADLTVRGSNLNISRASSTAHVVNEGTFEADVAGGAINFNGLTSFINNSDLIATNGGDFTFNSSWTNNGNISLADAGILTINGVGTNSASGQITLTNAVWTQNQTVTNAGTFTIDGTNLNKGIRTFTQTGTLIARNGSSVTGAFTNDGLLEVDGTLTINGNFTQTISGSLDIDIDGSAPSTDYDVLAITGSASLSGTLNLTTGFTALLNDTFDILTYTSLSGTFDTVNGIDLGAGLQYDLDYGVGDLTLTVVNV
jgi:hypothetical protein